MTARKPRGNPRLGPADRIAPPPKTSREKMKLRERALRMHNAGLTNIDISDETGIPLAAVKTELIAAMKAYADEPIEYKAMGQLTVLRDLRRALYTEAMAGNVRSIDRLLRVMDHEAKLLGMYAPQRIHAVIGTGVSEAEFAVTVEALLLRAGREVPRHIAAAAADGREAGISAPPVVIDGEVAS